MIQIGAGFGLTHNIYGRDRGNGHYNLLDVANRNNECLGPDIKFNREQMFLKQFRTQATTILEKFLAALFHMQGKKVRLITVYFPFSYVRGVTVLPNLRGRTSLGGTWHAANRQLLIRDAIGSVRQSTRRHPAVIEHNAFTSPCVLRLTNLASGGKITLDIDHCIYLMDSVPNVLSFYSTRVISFIPPQV